VLGLVANGTAQFAYARTVLSCFHKRRGRALAVVLTGSGVGSIFIPPLVQWTIAYHGWRSAYMLLGGAAALESMARMNTGVLLSLRHVQGSAHLFIHNCSGKRLGTEVNSVSAGRSNRRL
jgi:MFS family permease